MISHASFIARDKTSSLDKAEANSFRRGLIEKERRSRVNDVAAQILPGISLGKNIFCQAFRAITAIGFLNGFKHQIGHV